MKAPPRNAAPLGPAYRYGYIEREGEARTRAIVIVDCSRYDGAAVRKLTADSSLFNGS